MMTDFERTPDGWRFTERVYEVRYHDHSPLPGSAPDPAKLAQAQVRAGAEPAIVSSQ
jgi:hypothetical protein